MRNITIALVVALPLLALVARNSSAADTHVIIATDDLQWSYNGQKSSLISVDDLKKGDLVEVRVPSELQAPHGFVTIRKTPLPITPVDALVLKCGESESAKPDRVLREDCAPGASSQFGIPFTGSMKLKVLDTFKNDVPFWCVVHKRVMQGVLKLQTAPPK
jgi:hypothetical protein